MELTAITGSVSVRKSMKILMMHVITNKSFHFLSLATLATSMLCSPSNIQGKQVLLFFSFYIALFHEYFLLIISE